MLCDILKSDDRWESKSEIDDLIEKTALEVFRYLKKDEENILISVLCSDDNNLQRLNNMYRKIDSPTNVLSFPMDDEIQDDECGDDGELLTFRVLGCMAFSYDTVEKESKEQGKTFDDHMKHLVVHSVLHLLGYDHIEDKDAYLMEDLEIKILETLGVGNPYVING